MEGSTPAQERQRGFHASVENLPNIKILDGGDGKWLGENVDSLVCDVLSKYNNIDLVYAHNDVMALGAYDAVKKNLKNLPYYCKEKTLENY